MIEDIWTQFHQQLLVFITGKVNDKHLAEDILQDVFIKVIKNIDQLDQPIGLQAWLYKICRNSIIDYYRSKKIDKDDAASGMLDTLQVYEDNQESFADQAQLSACLSILINELPDDFNSIMHASELELIKQKNIAETHQLSLSATKSRILTGRKLLKKKLQVCCDFEFNENGPEANCKSDCGCSD